jgi:predicted nucleic acid-binding protein
LDADVLYPFSLRDTLLRLADRGFFQLYWSDEILDEVTRNLVASAGLTVGQATRLRKEMEKAFPASMITGYAGLIASMKNDPKDRHVTAAAVKAGAEVIITNNLRDFKNLPSGLSAKSADDFLRETFDLDSDRVTGVLREQATALKRPPLSFEQLLNGMQRDLPRFIVAVRSHLAG